jgi:hypothetical protein
LDGAGANPNGPLAWGKAKAYPNAWPGWVPGCGEDAWEGPACGKGKTNAGLVQRNWKEGVIRKPWQPWWGLVMC